MRTLLERYDAGERGAVWDELHRLGPLGATLPDVRRDAEAVARRTMERAASNVVELHRRLVALGFRFALPEEALVHGSAEHAAEMATLEAYAGPVPSTLRAFWSTIGAASFRGWIPSRGSAESWYAQLVDPFEFMPDVTGDIARAEDDPAYVDERGFRLSIAGDHLHKNDVSGGAPTEILLPSDEIDARVVEDDGEWFKAYMRTVLEAGRDAAAALPPPRDEPIWLVDYLRMYFAAGGFRRVAGTESYPEDVTSRLAADLLEI